MPPKAKGGDDLEALRAESTAVVTELIEEAYAGAISVLEDKRVARMLPLFAATQLRGSILQALELFHISADPGEADVLDTTWAADCEPEPVVNDTWSRLVFSQLGPEAKRDCVKKSTGRLPKALAVDDDKDGRRSSVDSVASFQRQQAAFNSSSTKQFNAPAPPIAKEDLRKPASNAEVDAEAKGVPPRSDKEIEANLINASRFSRRMVRELSDDARRVSELKGSFGKKDYLYDSKGTAIATTPVANADNLPAALAQPATRVSDESWVRLSAIAPKQDPPPAASELARAQGGSSRRNKGAAAKAGRPRLLGTDEMALVEQQPPLLQLISKPKPGVRLLEKGAEVYGGLLPIEPDAIPKRVYNKLGEAGAKMESLIGAEDTQRKRAEDALAPPAEPVAASTSFVPSPVDASRAITASGLGRGARDEHPKTAEWEALRGRERAPISRHNLPEQNPRILQRLQTQHTRSDVFSDVGGSRSGSAFMGSRVSTAASLQSSSGFRARSTPSRLTVHNPEKRSDILKPLPTGSMLTSMLSE